MLMQSQAGFNLGFFNERCYRQFWQRFYCSDRMG